MGSRCCHQLTFSIRLSVRSARLGRRVSSSSRVKGHLAREDGNEHCIGQPKVVLQDTPTGNADDGHARHVQSGDVGSTEQDPDTVSFTSETPFETIPGLSSQENFDEEVMIYYHELDSSLASQFLNLDDEASARTDQMVTPDIDTPMTSSSSLSGTTTGDTTEWEFEPTSLHFLDTKKFETVIDLAGGEKTVPWPWGDYKYRPPTPLSYLEPKDYIMEFQLAEMEEVLRDELMESMVQEAILDGERQRRDVKGKGRDEGEGEKPTTVAFNNQMVRGRTIYNP